MTSSPKRRILVIEDEYIVAFDLCAELVDLGYDVAGPAGTVEQALTLAQSAHPLDGAILDVNVNGQEVFPVADMLTSRNIPFVFLTGYDLSIMPDRYQHHAKIDKPVVMAELAEVLRDLLEVARNPC